MHKKHDQQQAEGREASHGSKRPSLIARNGLPVTSDSERSWSDSACCHGMQLGGGASTVLRANHSWLLSASYAVPCQACSSLALSRGQQRPKLYTEAPHCLALHAVPRGAAGPPRSAAGAQEPQLLPRPFPGPRPRHALHAARAPTAAATTPLCRTPTSRRPPLSPTPPRLPELGLLVVVLTVPSRRERRDIVDQRPPYLLVKAIDESESIAMFRIIGSLQALSLAAMDAYSFKCIKEQKTLFAVLYEARSNTGIDRMKIINAVAKSVPQPHKVDLSNPDKTIVVQIAKLYLLW
ncbi:unnamed protein product [Miscanthus lutarioriparius]|uniref:THUMP domain-containing protein n=1 Tax=Miscanthus lutarioriparius TaxID=422564 RepID=A0A811S223_9POAL|nr:unnamed protein product [Miscanthus lutarioriparius]